MEALAASRIELSTADGPMPAHLVEPSELRGAVLVFQDAHGVTPYLEDVCMQLGAVGWLALAPALYHRKGAYGFDYADAAGPERVNDFGPGDFVTDIDACLEHLAVRGIPAGATGAVGFCLGGAAALLAGVRHRLGAVVTFYGTGIARAGHGIPPLLELAPQLVTPWQGFYGDADRGAPVEDVLLLREAAARAPIPTEVTIYPGAGHAFHCDVWPERYDEAAARDAWERTLAAFEEHLDRP